MWCLHCSEPLARNIERRFAYLVGPDIHVSFTVGFCNPTCRRRWIAEFQISVGQGES